MKSLIAALEIKDKYNKMSLEKCVEEFEHFTGQKVSKEAIEEFNYVGLTNVDFFTSDWLCRYGLKSLFEFEEKENKNPLTAESLRKGSEVNKAFDRFTKSNFYENNLFYDLQTHSTLDPMIIYNITAQIFGEGFKAGKEIK